MKIKVEGNKAWRFIATKEQRNRNFKYVSKLYTCLELEREVLEAVYNGYKVEVIKVA